MTDHKLWWKSKTFWFNTSSILIAVILLIKDRPWMPSWGTEVLLIADGVANIILRFLTNEKILPPALMAHRFKKD